MAQDERGALPEWFDAFLTNVCEMPDRNSPEGEPDAIVATLQELRDCALNAIDARAAASPVSGAVRDVLAQLSSRLRLMRQDVHKGDTVFRCGFNDAIDSALAEIERIDRAEIERIDRDAVNGSGGHD
jgi:hypothetical protein